LKKNELFEKLLKIKSTMSDQGVYWPYTLPLIEKRGKPKNQVAEEFITHLNTLVESGYTVVTNATVGFFLPAIFNLTASSTTRFVDTDNIIDMCLLGRAMQSTNTPRHTGITLTNYLHSSAEERGPICSLSNLLLLLGQDDLAGTVTNDRSARNLAVARAVAVRSFLKHGKTFAAGG
jgi:hypothetical protein